MSITEFGALGEGIGSLLILITLIYLAVQNRQQQRLLLSQAYQARTDTSVNWIMTVGGNPQWLEAIAKSDRSETERQQVLNYWICIFHIWENLYFQKSLDVLDTETFNGRRKSLKVYLTNQSGMKEHWQISRRNIYHPDYAQWVDEIIQEIEQEEAAT